MLKTLSVPRRNASEIVVLVLFVLLSLILGLVGAVGGWFSQALLVSILLPLGLLLLSYRTGLYLCIIFLPVALSPLIPKAGPLSLTNVLLLGTLLSFGVNWILARMSKKDIVVPIPREFVLYYLLPIAIAAMIGSFHLGEIPRAFLESRNFAAYGLKEYWISLYFKEHLIIAMAFVFAAAVVVRGSGLGFAIATLVSGLLFVIGIFLVILLSGASLDVLRHNRGFLSVMGTHNNQAGALLIVPFAVALFTREYVSGRLVRFMLAVAAFTIAVGILLTFSRGSFLGMLIVSLFYIWHFKRFLLGFFILSIAIMGLSVAPDAIRDRLMTGLGGGSSVSAQLQDTSGKDDELTAGRVYIWSQRMSDIQRSPIWGNGLESGQWSDVVKSGKYYLDNAHNLYLTILTDLGIIGLILMVLFYRYLWRLVSSLSKDERVTPMMRGYFLAILATLFALPITGVAGGDYLASTSRWYLWVGIGVAIGYRRIFPNPVSTPAKGSKAGDRWSSDGVGRGAPWIAPIR